MSEEPIAAMVTVSYSALVMLSSSLAACSSAVAATLATSTIPHE